MSPEEASVLKSQAKQKIDAAEAYKAIDITTEILKNGPDAEAYTLRAEAYFLAENLRAAFSDMDAALRLGCEIPNKNIYIQACKHLTLALERHGTAEKPEKQHGILKLRAICLNALSEYLLAYHDAKNLPFLTPTRQCYLIRAEAVNGLGYAEAAERDREIAMLFYSDIEDTVEQAIKTLNAHDFQSGHTLLNAALSAFEEHGVTVPELVLLRGIAAWMTQSIEAAADDFDTARAADPFNHLDAVVHLLAPGRDGGVFPQILVFMTDNYERILENQKAETHALRQEARRKSEPVLARAYLNKALQARHLSVEFEAELLHSLALACRRMGDERAALGAFNRMLNKLMCVCVASADMLANSSEET